MADVDPALGQEILDVAQRQRVLHVHQHRQTDYLGRAVEIAERVAHGLKLPQPKTTRKIGLTMPFKQAAKAAGPRKRRVLECLGAALVSEWNGLPTDVQRRLFEHAASGKSRDAALLKTRIARFLHDHKDASDWR